MVKFTHSHLLMCHKHEIDITNHLLDGQLTLLNRMPVLKMAGITERTAHQLYVQPHAIGAHWFQQIFKGQLSGILCSSVTSQLRRNSCVNTTASRGGLSHYSAFSCFVS